MSIQVQKGRPLEYALLTQFNALLRKVAPGTGIATYHADVGRGVTTGDFTAPAASAWTDATASATTSATAVLKAERLRDLLVVHMCDTAAHKVADSATCATLAAIPAATTCATLCTLAEGIQTAWNAHDGSTTYHYTADTNDDSTSIVGLATVYTSLNAISTSLIAHIISAPCDQISLIEP
jgi:hypothetical protein